MSFSAISKFLDSLKNMPSNDDEIKDDGKQLRRELSFNNTAVSRIANQGYGLINSLMQMASSGNKLYILPFYCKFLISYNIFLVFYKFF